MKNQSNQLPISILKEGINALKTLPSYWMQKTWTRPLSVNFIVSTRCNSKCITCDSWKMEDHANELNIDEIQNLARQMAELKIPIVTIGGGEPTLRKDIWEIVDAFKKQSMHVQLTTNGLKMTSSQKQQMFASGLNRVTISMDSHLPEIYEKIRGVDGAKQVLENIRMLQKEAPSHLGVDTNTVLCRDNATTFLETIDYLIDMGIPTVNFSAVTTTGMNNLMVSSKSHLADIPMDLVESIVQGLLERKKKTNKIQSSTAFIKGIVQYYRDPSKIVFPCYAGYLTFDVFQDGSIQGCGNLPQFANIRKNSLKEIWFGKAANENRINMAQGKCPNCYISCKMEPSIGANPKLMPRFFKDKVLG